MNELECRHRVATARVAHLATMRVDGRPHVVPICFALDNNLLVTAIDGKPKRSEDLLRLDNIRAHPPVSVLVDHYDDDWTRLWWVRLDGVAEIVVDQAEHEYALRLLAAKYLQYQAIPPPGSVIGVTVSGWSGWEAAAR
ncbi:MAG: TIGR03668 family PPOX class F420-dependent oxidoreductase [Acidimicrobiia bacterium]